MCLLIQSGCDPVHSDRRAEAVDISDLMSHNQKAVLCLKKLPEGMGFDAGLDTGRLL